MSHSNDVSAEFRLHQLAYAADLTREAAVALRMPHSIASSAQLLLHRYFEKASLLDNAVVWVSGACLLLAAKAGGVPHSVRHIANVLHDRLVKRESNLKTARTDLKSESRVLDFYGAQGYDWKVGVLHTERRVLAAVGFRLTVDLPHKFVLVFVNALREQAVAPSWAEHTTSLFHTLLQTAWNFANDTLLLPTCAVERSEDIACACIFLSAKKLALCLPEGWQVIFGSCRVECIRVVKDIERIYSLGDLYGTFVDFSRTNTFSRFHPPESGSKSIDKLSVDRDRNNGLNNTRKTKRRRFENAKF